MRKCELFRERRFVETLRCAPFGAILRPYLQGQTHRKVGAQSFRSKGFGLGQRGCRGRSAISLTQRELLSFCLQQFPDQPSQRRMWRVARVLEPLRQRSWHVGKLASHRGLKCKIASHSGFVHCFQFSPWYFLFRAASPTDRRRARCKVRATGAEFRLAATILPQASTILPRRPTVHQKSKGSRPGMSLPGSSTCLNPRPVTPTAIP